MRFYYVDVFTDRPYAGNPLAVFVEESGLTDERRQQMAREVGFSETTFVQPSPEANEWKVRIFTPDKEIPFAGHPTIGTADVIARHLNPGAERLVLRLGVGPIPVVRESGLWVMDQNPPDFGPVLIDRDRAASLLGLQESDLDPRFPVRTVSTGLPCVFVPLRSLEALDRCQIQHPEYRRWLGEVGSGNVGAFVPEAREADCDVSLRVFVDDEGFAEDPATGSAAGNLAAYLLQHDVLGTGPIEGVISQGSQMGRPSRLHFSAHRADTIRVRIGGKAVPVASGDWPLTSRY